MPRNQITTDPSKRFAGLTARRVAAGLPVGRIEADPEPGLIVIDTSDLPHWTVCVEEWTVAQVAEARRRGLV